MKVIKIGIMPKEAIRARALAIARGEYTPKPGEPKIWFTSMKSAAEILSDDNRALLRTIAESRPSTIAELAEKVGRKPSNVSRTLKTMSLYGLVNLNREKNTVRPTAVAQSFQIIAA